MLQAAIIALILMGIYKFIDRNKPETNEPEIDWWVAFAFVFAPVFLIFLISIGVNTAELSPLIILAAYSLYFIIPFFYLKGMLDYPSKKSFKYAVWVPIVVIAVEVPIVILSGAANT